MTVILLLSLINHVFSKISIFNIQKAIDELKEELIDQKDILESSIVNPIYGYLFESIGALHNIRFYGPKLVSYRENNSRNYCKDESSDLVTKFVMDLFPSPSGTLCYIRNMNNNFGFKFNKNTNKGIELLSQIFTNILKSDDKDLHEFKGTKDLHELKGTKDLHEFKGTKDLHELKGTIDLHEFKEFEGTLDYSIYNSNSATSKYNSVFKDNKIQLMTIHAFILNALDTKEDLKKYLKCICKKINKGNVQINRTECDVINQIVNIQRQTIHFPYTKLRPPPSNGSIPVYNRKTGKYDDKTTFSDCVDIMLLNICNCLFYDPGKCCYSTNKLNENTDLAKFYKNHNQLFVITEQIRNDWSKVIQDLEDFEDFNTSEYMTHFNTRDNEYKTRDNEYMTRDNEYMTHFNTHDNNSKYKTHLIVYLKNQRNEIETGIINMMNILIKICNIDHNEFWKDFIYCDIKDQIKKLFLKISQITGRGVEVIFDQSNFKEIKAKDRNDFIGKFYLLFKGSKGYNFKIEVDQKANHSKMKLISCSIDAIKDVVDIDVIPGDYNLMNFIFKKYLLIALGKEDEMESHGILNKIYFSGPIDTHEQKLRTLTYIFDTIVKYEIEGILQDGPELLNEDKIDVLKNLPEIILGSVNLFDPGTKLAFTPYLFYSNITDDECFESWIFSIRLDNEEISKLYEGRIRKMNKESLELHIDFFIPAYKIKEIFNILEGWSNLKELKLSWDNPSIYELNLDDIIEGLGKLTKLENLDISNNSPNGESIRKIAEAIKKLINLNTLNISGNKMNFEGIRHILNAIVELKQLKNLNISKNLIGLEGAKYIAMNLKKFPNLININLSRNKIASEGIKHITRKIVDLQNLMICDVSDNETES